MTINRRHVLPAEVPRVNPVFAEILQPNKFIDIGDAITTPMISNFLASLPSLTTITHAIAKAMPVTTQKNLVVIAQIRNNTYKRKKMQVLFLTFNYDTLFYGHLKRQGFLGVFYDEDTKSVGIDVQAQDAIEWLNLNLHLYFQVLINLTTHQYVYQTNKPALRSDFVPVCNKASPVTLWLNQLVELMKTLDPNIHEITKLEMHNGDRFIALPVNFFLICYVDKLLIKVYDKKGWFRYLELDVFNEGKGNIYMGVNNKEATKLISRYMDACSYHKVSPYTVKER